MSLNRSLSSGRKKSKYSKSNPSSKSSLFAKQKKQIKVEVESRSDIDLELERQFLDYEKQQDQYEVRSITYNGISLTATSAVPHNQVWTSAPISSIFFDDLAVSSTRTFTLYVTPMQRLLYMGLEASEKFGLWKGGIKPTFYKTDSMFATRSYLFPFDQNTSHLLSTKATESGIILNYTQKYVADLETFLRGKGWHLFPATGDSSTKGETK